MILESELSVVVQNKLHLRSTTLDLYFLRNIVALGKSGENNSSIVYVLLIKEWKTRQKTGGVSRTEKAGEPHC